MEGIFKRNDIPESIKGLIRSELAEKSFRELADFLPEIVFELDLEGNFIYANHYLFESMGYTQEDLNQGFNPSQFVIPNDRERVKQNIKRLFQGEILDIINIQRYEKMEVHFLFSYILALFSMIQT